jgi:catechol 2,3-dioxygenase-like lactoylglutathione lyase family enzyme
MAIQRLVPMLHVADIRRSLAFYRGRLGFTMLSAEELVESFGWAHIQRDGVALMLAGGRAGGPIRRPGDRDGRWPVMFYFYPDDVVILHRELAGHGVDVGDFASLSTT